MAFTESKQIPANPDSDVVLERLMALHPKIIDLSLGRTLDLLDRLGRPQDRLPPVVHVAGTNGKGSVIAAMRAMAEAAGLTVHVYTSPHLVRFHERIRLTGTLIDETDLTDLLRDCERINDNRPITFFEITTCAALKAFSEKPADLLLLETGLGGRLDSTNVIEWPAATVITPISMDHTQFLGDTLEVIAAEKAAIQKPGVPSVVGPQDSTALQVVTDFAGTAGAPLVRYGLEWSAGDAADGGVQLTSTAWTGRLPPPNLQGAHQRLNVATAVVTALVLREQGIDLSQTAIEAGVQRVEWPARMQILTEGPAVDALPGWEIVLDGGHNAAAGAVLAAELGCRTERDSVAGKARPTYAVCGMLNSKAAADFLRPLVPHLHGFQAIAIPGEASSFAASELASIAYDVGLIGARAAADLEAAVRTIAALDGPGRLLICGSLYLAGRVLVEHA